MLCATCKTEISSSFRHAMAQNVCPMCGGSIMDEETLVLIENIESTIASEAKIRDETIHKIVMSLLAHYNITFRDEIPQNRLVSKQPLTNDDPKIAPPSVMKKAMAEQQDVIKAEDVIPEGVSDEEREKIMEEVVRKRYAVVDQIQSSGLTEPSEFEGEVETNSSDLFSEGGANPILEQDRLARLAKQKKAMSGGGGAFRRSG